MIKNILDLLALDEHFAQGENIEIAKGKYQYIGTFRRIKTIKKTIKMAQVKVVELQIKTSI